MPPETSSGLLEQIAFFFAACATWIAGGQAFADQAEAEATGLPVIEAVERLSEAVA